MTTNHTVMFTLKSGESNMENKHQNQKQDHFTGMSNSFQCDIQQPFLLPPSALQRKTSSPKIIEVCKFQGSISICEEFAVAFIIHVSLYCFCRVEGFPFFIAPDADFPNANFLSCRKH